MSILLLSIVLSGAILLNGIVHPNPESVVTQPLSPLPPAHDRLIAVLVAVCILGGAVCAFVWQYNHMPDEYAQIAKDLASAQTEFDEVMNRDPDFYWPFPSMVSIISEEQERDRRCGIADALITSMRTLDEGGPLDLERNLVDAEGEVLEGSAQATFQTPEALWIVSYFPAEVIDEPRLIFFEILLNSPIEQEVRDYYLDCTADVGYVEGNLAFEPADKDSYEEIMYFSEPDAAINHPRGEHWRAYWQEELDHAYQAAAQAIGL